MDWMRRDAYKTLGALARVFTHHQRTNQDLQQLQDHRSNYPELEERECDLTVKTPLKLALFNSLFPSDFKIIYNGNFQAA